MASWRRGASSSSIASSARRWPTSSPAHFPSMIRRRHRPIMPRRLEFAHQAPVMVVLISAPVREHKIPVWEQELSCGAVAMNLLHAANALGYVGGWITGWQAYNDRVRAAFCDEGERIAGFIFIGTPGNPLEERPRPLACGSCPPLATDGKRLNILRFAVLSQHDASIISRKACLCPLARGDRGRHPRRKI